MLLHIKTKVFPIEAVTLSLGMAGEPWPDSSIATHPRLWGLPNECNYIYYFRTVLWVLLIFQASSYLSDNVEVQEPMHMQNYQLKEQTLKINRNFLQNTVNLNGD